MNRDWIDISVPLRRGMVHWPGDPAFRAERVMDVTRGDSHTLSEICMGSHSGTHIDAPLHFLKGGMGVDRMPLNIAVGRARVLEISGRQSIQPEELAGAGIRPGERILFKTRNSSYVWQAPAFVEDYVFVSQKAARLLAQRQVALVGVDYLSVGGPGEGRLTHEILLGSGIWIVEGLDLSGVAPGSYDLVCLPLRLDDGDGAPARAVLRPVWKRAK